MSNTLGKTMDTAQQEAARALQTALDRRDNGGQVRK
jgi:hypothetical protein